MPQDFDFFLHCYVVFQVKVLANYHTKKFGFIHSFYHLISQDDFVMRSRAFLTERT